MLEVTFDKDRETKNTVRFEERVGEDPPMVGTLYLQRWALRRLGDPTVLRVQIDAGAAGSASSTETPGAHG